MLQCLGDIADNRDIAPLEEGTDSPDWQLSLLTLHQLYSTGDVMICERKQSAS